MPVKCGRNPVLAQGVWQSGKPGNSEKNWKWEWLGIWTGKKFERRVASHRSAGRLKLAVWEDGSGSAARAREGRAELGRGFPELIEESWMPIVDLPNRRNAVNFSSLKCCYCSIFWGYLNMFISVSSISFWFFWQLNVFTPHPAQHLFFN